MDVPAHSREFGDWLSRFMPELEPGTQVVELGCGLGFDAAWMTGQGYQVTALDLSLDRVSRASERAREARFVVADLRRGLPVASGAANVVVASLSLHYFSRETTVTILADVARILRPRGMILCRVNVAGEKIARWGEGVEHEPDFFEVEPGLFKRFFTADSLEEMLSPVFDVELIQMEQTTMSFGAAKRTLVARARRRD